MNIITIVLLSAIALLSAIFQIKTFDGTRDFYATIYCWDPESGSQLTVPFYCSLALLTAGVLYSIINFCCDTTTLLSETPRLIFGFFLLAFALFVKAYFSILVLGYILGQMLYSALELGRIEGVVLLDRLVDWALGARTPMAIHFIYSLIVVLLAMRGSLKTITESGVPWKTL